MPWRRADDPHNPENRNAGNGGDLVKHCVYLSFLQSLLRRPPWHDGLRLHECHAGRGMYRIDPGDPRRALLANLTDGVLATAQTHAREALSLDSDWYAGSALLNLMTLTTNGGTHRYTGYEWAPDTRRILGGVLAEAGGSVETLVPGGDDRCDGETIIADELATMSERDVILLDPFGLWQRPKLAERRARYRRIFEARARHPAPPPLAMFWTWSHAGAADADLDGSGAAIDNGYRVLLELVGARPLLRIRWHWDIPCAMWLLAPTNVLDDVADRLHGELAKLPRPRAHGSRGPDMARIG